MSNGNTTMADKCNGYSLEEDLRPIIDGKVALPNFKELPIESAASTIAACYGGSIRGNAKLPGKDHPVWAQFFLDHGQGGSLHGSGIVLLYVNNYLPGKTPRAGTFAICEHTKQASPDARPNRGWHPGSCTKCGLDMTVDSGD